MPMIYNPFKIRVLQFLKINIAPVFRFLYKINNTINLFQKPLLFKSGIFYK